MPRLGMRKLRQPYAGHDDNGVYRLTPLGESLYAKATNHRRQERRRILRAIERGARTRPHQAGSYRHRIDRYEQSKLMQSPPQRWFDEDMRGLTA